MRSVIDHPAHYNAGDVEAIDAIRSALTKEGYEGFLAGNVMKYLFRYQHKGGVEDCRKAAWYLDRLVAFLGGKHEDQT